MLQFVWRNQSKKSAKSLIFPLNMSGLETNYDKNREAIKKEVLFKYL